VRRPARLDPARRGAPALRHGVHHQPLPGRGRRRRCSTGRSPARSASSWRCSSTCAARPGSPRSACPTTRCSSSTASWARSAT
ncbi:hypothetical protein CTI14_67395, partial [Methylobacterium radiotolerans]